MWSNGHPFGILTVTPSAATSYTVSGIDIHNCPLSQVVSVGVNQLPNILASASKASICKGESVSLSAAGGASYLWNTGATGSVVTITPPLDMTYNYTVKGTDANGCSNTGFVSVTVNRCTGLNEQSASASINVYPNPSNGALNVSVGEVSKNMSIKVYNTLGSVVKVQNIAQENTSLNLQDESTGVYFIYVMENDKPVHISRIMKQ
jgi:hypothetical protein